MGNVIIKNDYHSIARRLKDIYRMEKVKNMGFKMKRGDFFRLGASKGKTWANFCMVCRKETECKVLIYKKGQEQPADEITVPKEFSKGNLRAVHIEGLDLSEYDYNFWIDGKVIQDPYARRIVGREIWADLKRDQKIPLRCRYEENRFSWRGECETEIKRKDMVLYKLHVRGFTKGLPEGLPEQGTFRGLARKLSYLKSLGVTSIELMPVYEFEEVVFKEQEKAPAYRKWKSDKKDKIQKPREEKLYRINYWGYGRGMYFAPKASYAAGDNPGAELKECILQMHKKGMECILEMDFFDGMPQAQILEVLKYWVREYHVDGFHLQGGRIPLGFLMEDPYLGRTKLLYRGMEEYMVPKEEKEYPRAFLDTDEFLYPSRKLLCGMGGNIWEFADQMKKQNLFLGYINYIADNNGFTLKDLFTYGQKHNEANGENNADGPDFNFSINCGVEGETTSRNVQKIRDRRMKNAIAMLFLAQGVPMLMAGDEDGNSQQGNNNAYCQDNEIGWKNWNLGRPAKEFLRYVKKIIAFRKEHLVIRMEQPMQLLDTKSYGYPDLSYHEEAAWISQGFFNREALGILYCGKYAKEHEDVYLGFNFSDLHRSLALPKQRGKRKWYLAMDTAVKNAFLPEAEELQEMSYMLEAQSVCIIIGK